MAGEFVVRRVVTGVGPAGEASVLADGVVAEVSASSHVEGWAIATVWQDGRAPQVPVRSIADGLMAVEDQPPSLAE